MIIRFGLKCLMLKWLVFYHDDGEVSIYNNFLYTIELANRLYDFEFPQKKNQNNNS